MSETLLKSAIAAVLKADKFEIVTAEAAEDGAAIRFTARSKSGQLKVNGIFCDPQGQLDLDEPSAEPEAEDTSESPGANEVAEDDDEDHH